MPEIPLEEEPSRLTQGIRGCRERNVSQSPTSSVSSVLPMPFLSHLSCSMILRLSSQ